MICTQVGLSPIWQKVWRRGTVTKVRGAREAYATQPVGLWEESIREGGRKQSIRESHRRLHRGGMVEDVNQRHR
jgi:hypothetical protein